MSNSIDSIYSEFITKSDHSADYAISFYGKTCALEAFDPDRNNPVDKNYFIAFRWSPEKNTSFRIICDYIQAFEPEPKLY